MSSSNSPFPRLAAKLKLEPLPQPEAIHLFCAMCNRAYDEYPPYHEPRLVSLCISCQFRRRLPSGSGIKFDWVAEFDIPPTSPLDNNRLLYKQSKQIGAALAALEAVCKR